MSFFAACNASGSRECLYQPCHRFNYLVQVEDCTVRIEIATCAFGLGIRMHGTYNTSYPHPPLVLLWEEKESPSFVFTILFLQLPGTWYKDEKVKSTTWYREITHLVRVKLWWYISWETWSNLIVVPIKVPSASEPLVMPSVVQVV